MRRNDTASPTLESIMETYRLKDDVVRADELAFALTPQLIDEFEQKLHSLWKHNHYRLKHVVEPAIRDLRANLP